jgi:serine O-acetyltransferase
MLALIREDRWVHHGRWSEPGFHALAVNRFGTFVFNSNRLVSRLLGPLYFVLFYAVRTLHGIELPWRTTVGRRVRIAHQNGIVIHDTAVIGDDCAIRHNVTIGLSGVPGIRRAPALGRGVEIGVGAVIIGPITIGDNVRIGPNTVVMTNIPAGATVVASPPRVLTPPNPRRPRKAPAGRPPRGASLVEAED